MCFSRKKHLQGLQSDLFYLLLICRPGKCAVAEKISSQKKKKSNAIAEIVIDF